jgi:hypothetical protein
MPTEQEKLRHIVKGYISDHIYLDKETAIVILTRPDDSFPWTFHSAVHPVDVEWELQRVKQFGGLQVKKIPATDI